VIPQVANMPNWMKRIMADAHPSRVFESVKQTALMRDDVLSQNLSQPISEPYHKALAATMEAYSRWIHSGSPAIRLDDRSKKTLEQLSSPRFHTLTRMDGEGRTYLVDFLDSEGGVIDVLVRATRQGPHVSVFVQAKGDPISSYVRGFSGVWDILRWHGALRSETRPWVERQAPVMRFLLTAMNAVAAIEESREILRRAPEPKKSKSQRRKQRSRSRTPRPLVYWLERNALDAWVEKTVHLGPPRSVERQGPHERTGVRRLHNCREHYRRTWVLRPREGEAVIEVSHGRPRKDGSRATLYRVMRVVQAHARGTDVRPQALQVKGVE